MAGPGWADFDELRHSIKTNTVDKLKQIISGLNDETHARLSRVGKKQDLIDRIVHAMDNYRRNDLEEQWTKARAVLYQVRNTGFYSSRVPSSLSTATNGHNSYGSSSGMKPGTSSMGVARFDPYAPPRKSSGSSYSSPVKLPAGTRQTLTFKESPFFRVDQTVSIVAECPESASATDRRTAGVSFSLNSDQINKIREPGSKYQLRLFCTSSSFYAPAWRSSGPALIEFPPTCEVRVNSTQITANLKGMKKKPGTAPPPDITKYSKHNSTQNRVDMVYVNSQQPVQNKKYYLVVMLVESVSVDDLLQKLRQSKYRTFEEIQDQRKRTLNDDDDIVAGPTKMSLKCPLMFTRVGIPCRSSKCVHPQCFDAQAWFSVNEQTTQWLCPVCEKVIDTEDLIIDGYFDGILKSVPSSVEDVMVEADGEWHTADNKYGTPAWKAAHPPTGPAADARPSVPRSPQKPASSASINGEKTKLQNTEIYLLDSDDEDEHRVKQELSPPLASSSGSQSSPQRQRTEEVIDLTLDSDDELPPPPPPPPRVGTKRTASQADLSPSRQPSAGKKMDIDRLTTPYHGPAKDGYSSSYPSTSQVPLPHVPLPPPPNLSVPYSRSPPDPSPSFRDPVRALPRADSYHRMNGSSSWS